MSKLAEALAQAIVYIDQIECDADHLDADVAALESISGDLEAATDFEKLELKRAFEVIGCPGYWYAFSWAGEFETKA